MDEPGNSAPCSPDRCTHLPPTRAHGAIPMKWSPFGGTRDPRGTLPFLPYSRGTRSFIAWNLLFGLIVVYCTVGVWANYTESRRPPDVRELSGKIKRVGYTKGGVLRIGLDQGTVAFQFVGPASPLRSLERGKEVRLLYDHRGRCRTLGHGLELWVNGKNVYSMEDLDSARRWNGSGFLWTGVATVVVWALSWVWWVKRRPSEEI